MTPILAAGGNLAGLVQNACSTANQYVSGIAVGLAGIYALLMWVDRALNGPTDTTRVWKGLFLIIVAQAVASLFLSAGGGGK